MIRPVYIRGILFAKATKAHDKINGIAVITNVFLGPIASMINPPTNDPGIDEIEGNDPIKNKIIDSFSLKQEVVKK